MKIVIIGAGPTGLGAGYRLSELGHDFKIFEKNLHIGGISASFVDENRFTWDIGGHVVFSHYDYFDNILNKALKKKYLEHVREAWIWIMDRFVPYPFQNNIKFLPKEALLECLMELIDAQKTKDDSKNFKEWILNIFGEGIAKYFMFPYNYKVWAHKPEVMNKNWIAERVSVVDVERILKNIIYDRIDAGWGPNSTFRFPEKGGTGAIFRHMGSYFQDKIFLEKEVVRINSKGKKVFFADKSSEDYDILINTMPLDLFMERSDINTPDAKKLKHSSSIIVGIGIKGKVPEKFRTKCWNYFPEHDCPFYRVTVFSNYSPNNAPSGHWSLMTETSYSKHKKVDKSRIVDETIKGLINTKFISPSDRISTKWTYDLEYSYPVPTLERDSALEKIQPKLERRQIYSRGRFGAWKYEVGNMDHSVMQGVELVDRLLKGKKETTY